jgi:hypothetical protein
MPKFWVLGAGGWMLLLLMLSGGVECFYQVMLLMHILLQGVMV